MKKITFVLLLLTSLNAYSKEYDCIQIGTFDIKSTQIRLMRENEKRRILSFINGNFPTMTMSMRDGSERTSMSLGLLGISANNTNIESKGAMTTYRTYNLEKPLIVRVVDGVVIKKDRLILIDVGTDAFLKKFGEYESRFACMDD
jgi:hypothetical protein